MDLIPLNAAPPNHRRRLRGFAAAAGAVAGLLFALVPGGAAETDGSPASAATGGTLCVLAYNIHHGEGVDGKLDLERIAALIRREQADLVALQEVDKKCGRSGGVDQAAELARLTGMHHAFGPFMNYDGGEYGLAILSRFPILESMNHRLPPGAEPRSALEVRVRVPAAASKTDGEAEPEAGQIVSIVSVHLDWIDEDRRRYEQAQALVRRFDEITHPLIVAGDFNDTPGSRTIDLFANRWTPVPKKGSPLTWPSGEPKVEIDHIFVSRLTLPDSAHCRVLPEKTASDHRPVAAELALPRER